MSCFIIAEAGVNHNGHLDLAYKLCDEAKKAGADAVKFQVFDADKLVTKTAMKAEYQSKNDRKSSTQYEMLKKLALSKNDFLKIKKHCCEIGIKFMATAFDEDSLTFLYEIGVDVIKVPSGEITNLPYLLKISHLWKTIILSTGMASLEEIKDAYAILSRFGSEVIILHCTTEYPAPLETVNLRFMENLGTLFKGKYGYSDHTKGIEVPVAAVAMGASVVEKHFTLNKKMEGPDHKASLNPKELKSMICAIRNVETALGSKEKVINECELKNRTIVRKSIVAKTDIKKGDTFTIYNLTVKRPGNGLSPMKWFDVIGKKASKDFVKDELIEL